MSGVRREALSDEVAYLLPNRPTPNQPATIFVTDAGCGTAHPTRMVARTATRSESGVLCVWGQNAGSPHPAVLAP